MVERPSLFYCFAWQVLAKMCTNQQINSFPVAEMLHHAMSIICAKDMINKCFITVPRIPQNLYA